MQEWADGVPSNPAGWLHSVARHLAVDQLRRERTSRAKEDGLVEFIEATAMEELPAPPLRGELGDDQLTMIFVACHPCNTVPSQVALALRTLCGFEVSAIARALYATEDAIEKRLVLARRRIREEGVSFELPTQDDLGSRLDSVLGVLYLLFNEASYCTTGPDLVQEDLAAEAMHLASALAQHATTRRPRVLALLALMHFHASRFPARVDAGGELVSLPEQDRSLWDARHIDEGMRCLATSAEGDQASSYHYEAAIAAVHATSASHAATDWRRVVSFYDELLAVSPSPSARLSRAIAIGYRDGPKRCLDELGRLADHPALGPLAALHAARADAYLRLHDLARCDAALVRALACSSNPHERRFLERQRARLAG
jgi:RNA polymerase sigma-70 factor (ECF subfamily)